MTTVEELQGIVAGLTAIVKQQAEAQKATNTQIANLTEALLAHGGPPTAPATAQVNSTPGRAGSEVWNRVYMIAPVKKFGRVRLSTNFP